MDPLLLAINGINAVLSVASNALYVVSQVASLVLPFL